MSKTVVVGGNSYPVPPLVGYKAIRAGAAIARIGGRWGPIQEKTREFIRNYPPMRVDRQAAKLPLFANPQTGDPVYGEEDFGDAEFIEIPVPLELIPGWEIVMHVFNDAYEIAREEVVYLLALVLIPNGDLRKAWEDGKDAGADEAVTEFGGRLLFDGTLSELAQVVITAGEALREEFAEEGNPLSRLLALLPTGNVSEPQPTKKSPSSTGSRKRTAGQKPKSSSARPPVVSEPSPA